MLIGGLTLIDIAIQQALRVGLYDVIIVSTDDPDVKYIASKYAVVIDDRDPELTGGHAPLIAVIRNLILKFNWPEDAVVSLQVVTNPLRIDADIVDGLRLFEDSDRRRTLVSVCEVDYPIEMTWKLDGEGHLYSPFELTTTRKQDFTPSYRWNDALVIDLARNFLLADRKLFGKHPLPYFMPPERSLYIDYEWQADLIRKVFVPNNN